ncbi:MAG TPA: sugar transferase [Acidobacteriaceae bacterium]|jgi:lipopolysaccharide/colanic/teichoic acid biosynthesis glycosyltransferase|nr:sugar transferase [Acidobacteriaceae bacterium]
MSSLSFENLFQPDAANHTEGVPRPVSEAKIGKLAPAWSDPLQGVLPAQAAAVHASAWALSPFRRALDCASAVLALVAFFPIMFGVAVLVRLGSSGPVFFCQRRMGRHGREFTLYKFRSMSPKKGSHSCITVSGDNRITRVGAFLRRYKLDELPQFWNVLRGDMGLVGPRPKLPHHEALHMLCRPGITGVATLAFRNEEEFLSEIPEDQLEVFYEAFVKPAKAQLDLHYLQTASLVSDVKVLWQTATACFASGDDSLSQSAATIVRYQMSRKATGKSSSTPGSQAMAGQRACSAGLSSEL